MKTTTNRNIILRQLLRIFPRNTKTAVVSWLSPSLNFTLQQNTNGIGSVNWSIVSGIQDNSTTRFSIVSPPTGNRFCRLFKP